jgi:tripartite-type tricarboxylate transporter receptor subunit TctC
VERVYKGIQAALKSPELVAEFDREGATILQMSSAEFGEFIKEEIGKWGRVVKEGHITAQ